MSKSMFTVSMTRISMDPKTEHKIFSFDIKFQGSNYFAFCFDIDGETREIVSASKDFWSMLSPESREEFRQTALKML